MSTQQQPKSIDEIRAEVSRMLDSLDPFMPISATVVFKVARNKESTFRANADALQEATRKLPGCNVFVYQKHKPLQGVETDPIEYLVYEDWQEVKLFRVQWDSEHIKRFQYTIGELVV